jgi:hypothetical protein
MAGPSRTLSRSLILLAHACGAWRPHSPASLHAFLKGEWTVTKTMDYVRGGRKAHFAGLVGFSAMCQAPLTLHSVEDGVTTFVPEMEEFSSYKRLLWDCSGEHAVEVSFDEAFGQDEERAILERRRFFHTLSWAAPTAEPILSEHPCGPDVYRGRITFDSPDSFCLTWDVSGPRKLGSVVSRFRRADRE